MTSKVGKTKVVREALAINSLDVGEPSKECMRLLQNYIDGYSTIEENKKIIIKRYQKKWCNTI